MISQLDWYAEGEPIETKPPAARSGVSVRLLCAGDLHLGRRSTRLPEHVEPAPLPSAQCWGALVELAIGRSVHAVLLSGDVVDRANRYFEAFGPLETGLRRLAAAGIQTFAVAGNHDFDVLPRLADAMGNRTLRLLGRGGQWERAFVNVNGRPALNIDGWSFPAEHVTTDPLTDFRPASANGMPLVGLLHADLDKQASRYAPVAAAALRATPVDLWVLGHVHQPGWLRGAGVAPLLYPGSPQALDPGETGPHGPWLLEIDGSTIDGEQVPLSAVRYDTIRVELSADRDRDVESVIAQEVRDHLERAMDGAERLRYLSLRLRLTGRTSSHRALTERVGALARDLEITRGQATAFVERVRVDTRPPVDLEMLARGSDPPAVLARLVLALESGDEEPDRLVRAAEQRATEIRGARQYLQLGSDGGSAIAEQASLLPASVLQRQAVLLLDELLAQKEG